MKRSSAVFGVLGVLVLGVVVGILATHTFYSQKLRSTGSFSSAAGGYFAERLQRELALTPEQSEAIGRVLDQTRREAEALRMEIRPQIGSLMAAASEKINEILTEDQRGRFAELQREQRGRAEHFFLGPPPGGGGPRWGRPGGYGRRPPGDAWHRDPSWQEVPEEGAGSSTERPSDND